MLDDIQEGNIELQKPPKRIPVIIEDDPYRLTDYPRRNSHDSPSRRSSLSISAVSESSLTSEGSSVMSHDATKVPKKKILKHPHGQRKHSRHRVRFNLTEDESDNSSVYSFESMSTASEIYGRARSGVLDVIQGWKGDFELSPPRGSTGLTPGKHLHPRNHHHHHRQHHHHHGLQYPNHHHLYVRQDQRWSPTLHQTHSDSSLLGQPNKNGFPSPMMQSLLGGSSTASPTHVMGRHAHSFSASDVPPSNINGKVMQTVGSSSAKSTSPLTSSTFSSDRHMQSTPLSHSYSESAISTKAKALGSPFARDHRLTVLKLNPSSIPELEESTLEDKKKGHIFQFPHNSPVSQGNNSSGQQGPLSPRPLHPKFSTESNNCGGNSSTNQMLFADDDDADDYDHLSPLKNGESESPIDAEDVKTEKQEEHNKTGLDNPLLSFLLVKKIVGRAKAALKEDAVTTSKNSAAAQDKEAPPPVPKKLRSRVQSEVKLGDSNQEVRTKKKDGALNLGKEVAAGGSPVVKTSKGRHKPEGKATNMESVSRAIKSTSDLDRLYLRPDLASSGNNIGEKSSASGGDIEDFRQRRRKKSKSPPPIPRKTTHIRRQDRDALGNPLIGVTTLGYSSSSQSTNETNPSQETTSDTSIVPPPPEFSGLSFFAEAADSGSSKVDSNLPSNDGLGASNSNTTLISETVSELSREEGGLPAGAGAPMDTASLTSSLSSSSHKNKHKGLGQLHDEAKSKRTSDMSSKDLIKSSARSDIRNVHTEDFVDHGEQQYVRKMGSESVLPGNKEVSVSSNSTKTHNLKITQISESVEKDKSSSSPSIDRPDLKESKSSTGKNPSAPRRIPNRPAPPPPNRSTQSTLQSQSLSSVATEKVTEEEKQALNLVCPPNSSKMPMMAPVVHDTEKHIQDMMAEIITEHTIPNITSFGK